MKEKKIYEAITNIGDDKLKEAEEFRVKKRSKRIVATISAAAVLVVCIVGTIALYGNNPTEPPESTPPAVTEGATPTHTAQDTIVVSRNEVVDLLENVQKNAVSAPKEDVTQELTDFSLSMFKELYSKDDNVLISPLSLVSALGMTANGAGSNTLSQMEDVLGTDLSMINNYMANYLKYVRDSEHEGVQVNLANSIWYNSAGLQVQKEFLQNAKDYYDPSVYAAPFDENTLNEINDWVLEQTEGMIENAAQEISPDTVAYLVNALYFNAEWGIPYGASDVEEGIFTASDGSEQNAEYMWSNANRYLETENATGFVQEYAQGEDGTGYSFVALLPNEGMSVEELLQNLDGAEIQSALDESEASRQITVVSELPKFSFDYDVQLNAVLESMGMSDAFDIERADFTAMGSSDMGNIFIDEVLHKTIIEVDEWGTKAGAYTSIEQVAGGVADEYKEVTLDRPFVFMIVDDEEYFPIFIGAVNQVKTPETHYTTVLADREETYETVEELEEAASAIVQGTCIYSETVFQNDTMYTLSKILLDGVYKSPENLDEHVINVVEMGGSTTYEEYEKNIGFTNKNFDQGETSYPPNTRLVIDVDGYLPLQVEERVLLYLGSADGFLESVDEPLYSILGDYDGKFLWATGGTYEQVRPREDLAQNTMVDFLSVDISRLETID